MYMQCTVYHGAIKCSSQLKKCSPCYSLELQCSGKHHNFPFVNQDCNSFPTEMIFSCLFSSRQLHVLLNLGANVCCVVVTDK